MQEESRNQVEDLESTLRDLQQKHREEVEEQLSTLNVAFAAHDKAFKDLDGLAYSFQQEALSFKEQLMKNFMADFAVKVEAYYKAGWYDEKMGHDPILKILTSDPDLPSSLS